MRISDWSSDVCSSDLLALRLIDQPGAPVDQPQREVRFALPRIAENQHPAIARRDAAGMDVDDFGSGPARKHGARLTGAEAGPQGDKLILPVATTWGGDGKSVRAGKRVAVRGDLGGRRSIKKKNQNYDYTITNNQNVVYRIHILNIKKRKYK